jgi:hypothetical protein
LARISADYTFDFHRNSLLRLLEMNTAMPVGEPISEGFEGWKQFAAMAPEIPVSGMLAMDAREAINIMDTLAHFNLGSAS